MVNHELVRSIGNGCDKEAERVIKSIPQWMPATKNGKPLEATFTIPIKYKLADDEEVETSIEPIETAPKMSLYDIKIFPNPATDIITIQSKLEAVPTTIWLVDVNGREFYKEELKDFDGILNKEIDITKAPQGTLVLQVQQGESVLTHKFIKQ